MPFIPPDNVQRSAIRQQGEAVIPADFGEYAGAAAEAFLYNDRSISRPLNMAKEYRQVLDAYRDVTGRSFQYHGKRPGGRGGRIDVEDVIPHGEESIAAFWARMSEEMDRNPALADALGAHSHNDVMQRVYQQAQQLEAQRDDVAARATGLAALGGIAGEISAVVTDPPIAASMVLAAPAASGIMSGMLIEAGIAGGSEALVQPIVQGFRAEAGLEAGFGKGVENVLTAATAGAGLYGAFRVAGLGAEQLAELIRGRSRVNDMTEGELNIADMTDEEKVAALEVEKAALVEASQPIGRPTPEDEAAHQRRLEEARLALVQGRAVRVSADAQTLDLGMETISIRGLAQRVKTLESVGLDLDEMLPNLGDALELANGELDVVIARSRVDGVVRELRTAVKEERPVLEAVREAEERLIDVTRRRQQAIEERARFQQQVGAIIREEGLAGMSPSTRARFDELEQELANLPPEASARERADIQRDLGRLLRAGFQRNQQGLVSEERALAALDEADRQRVRTLERRAEKTTDAASRQGFLADRRRLLDKGRKRVEREGQVRAGEAGARDAEIKRLTAVERELEAEYTEALKARERAGEALLEARRRREAAAGAFNERIGAALSDSELKRLNTEWLVEGRVHGDPPDGQVRRVQDAEEDLGRLIEEQQGEAAPRIAEARMQELSDDAVAALPEQALIETADGRAITPAQAVREIDEERAFLEEFKRCFANANAS